MNWRDLSNRIAAAYGLAQEDAQRIVKVVLEAATEDARECLAVLDRTDAELVIGARAIVSRLLHAQGAWNRAD